MAGPLEGILALDLTWVLAGPFASMVLCDLGAEVIKVEWLPYGDVGRTQAPFINGESGYFMSLNRGKKSLALNLKAPRGRELLLRLVERADLLMENFTPGTMERLGLGYDVLRQRNPRLIYAATSGFGQTGPWRERPALDIVVQGMGGVMSITGQPGGPPVRPGLSLGDIAAGLYTAIGILAALQERERSGQGQMVDVAMLDCQVAILENAFIRYFATGQVPGPLGTRHPTATPFQAFPTRDGWLVLALSWGVENQWELLCATIGRVDLIDDPRFDTPQSRTENHHLLEPILNEALGQRSTAEWLAEFEGIGLPCGPVNDIAQAAAMPQVAAREMLVEVAHPRGTPRNRRFRGDPARAGPLKLPNVPVKLSRTPGGVRGPAPALGQHTDELLAALLGLGGEELARLRQEGAIL